MVAQGLSGVNWVLGQESRELLKLLEGLELDIGLVVELRHEASPVVVSQGDDRRPFLCELVGVHRVHAVDPGPVLLLGDGVVDVVIREGLADLGALLEALQDGARRTR